MSLESEEIKRAVELLQAEVKVLKENYHVLNSEYTDNLLSLKKLTQTSSEAASRAAKAAQRAAKSATFCAETAKLAESTRIY